MGILPVQYWAGKMPIPQLVRQVNCKVAHRVIESRAVPFIVPRMAIAGRFWVKAQKVPNRFSQTVRALKLT